MDCRSGFITRLERTLNYSLLGEATLENDLVTILTPLMKMTKKQTVELMQELGHLDWYEDTHTCYAGEDVPCRQCHACIIRERGFVEAGIPDPLVIKHKQTWPPHWASA